MGKNDTRRKIVNPHTGRKVFMTGKTGQQIRDQNKKKQAKKYKTSQTATKGTNKTKSTCSGNKCKTYASPGATIRPSPMIKMAGKTKGYAPRPSARACFDQGFCGKVIYAGRVHEMTWDSLGRPRWKAM